MLRAHQRASIGTSQCLALISPAHLFHYGGHDGMPTVSTTAYPQLPLTITDHELREVYTPTQEERQASC